MRCIRKNCKNYAEIHLLYGTIPCEACRQEKDGSIPSRRKFQFANIGKLHRVQAQRDAHLADLLQPFEGNRPNVDFFKNYPDKVDDYQVRGELEKI